MPRTPVLIGLNRIVSKAILFTLTLTLTTFFLSAQTSIQAVSDGTSITVTTSVHSDDGNVIFGLYNESSFMKNPINGLEGEIVDGKSTVTFTNVSPGTYAIVLFHDKNSNKQMDFEANGMPIEMYGVSNNNMSMGPPSWTDAKFEVASEAVNLDIRM